MASRTDRRELRRFGVVVGGMLGLIGLWPSIVRGEQLRSWMVGLAIALIVPAFVAPRMLAPAHRAWMVLGDALGWINTRLVLGVIFFGVVTPTGIVLRLVGRDPMRRVADPRASTYRVSRPSRPGAHTTRQF